MYSFYIHQDTEKREINTKVVKYKTDQLTFLTRNMGIPGSQGATRQKTETKSFQNSPNKVITVMLRKVIHNTILTDKAVERKQLHSPYIA